MRVLILFLLLTGCTGANHLGNPATLPFRAALVALENANYAQRRRAVKEFITTHQAQMKAANFEGMHTAQLLATIPPETHAKIRKELAEGTNRPDFPEFATVIVMVHLP